MGIMKLTQDAVSLDSGWVLLQ